MNNPNPKLRYALGISALTALSLAMVGCGGSSSSAPAAATNQSPSAPGITATGLQITGHPMTFNLSAVDPEGDQITFTVSGAATASVGPTSGSGSFTFTPAVQTTPSSQALSLSVIAKDSKGASSAATPFNWTEAPNHGPQFFSLDTPPVFAGGSPTIAVSYTVVSQDQDTDDVRYDALTVVSMIDNNGNAYTGAAPSINTTTGVITWAGTVPSTAVSVTAKVDVTAKDYLPGTTTAVGGSTVQHLTLTYNSGNTPPVITTNSLPPLAANHYIPTKKGDPGYQMEALDANAGDTLTWRVVSPAGFKLVAGADQYHKYLVSDTGFTPQAAGGSYTVVIGVSDGHNPEVFKTNTISVITDAVPTLNSNDYTETVSGVVAFDSSRVKNDLVGPHDRKNFYPGNIDWTGFPYVNTPSAVFIPNRTAPYLGTAETTGGIDAAATNNAFSNYANAYPAGFLGPLADESFPALGWNARTVFKDGEGDKILYSVLPGSVFVAGTPYNTVGQTFTLSPSTLPLIPGGAVGSLYGNSSPDVSEYPKVNAGDGTIQWRPVMTSEAGMGLKYGDVYGFPGMDNFGNYIWSTASTWSFIVQATERVYNPLLEPATDPYVTINANKGQIQYVIKVQPNNAPWIGPLTTIPNATTTVAGALINEVVNPTTTLSIGGGASIAVAPTWYGRPSIQEPESRRYDVATSTDLAHGGAFDYTLKNTTRPAIWRWLMAAPGGHKDIPNGLVADVEIYDGDQTTTSGHMDTIFATMGAPTVPAADTTDNKPALAAGSVDFFNPWLMAGDAGAFTVTWGPNRIQYLIARVTASAAYKFPVEVRDQYERINNGQLNINPIFGTVRFTNTRTRNVRDAAAESAAVKRGGTLSGANPGDPIVAAPAGTPYTFTYLPFPGADPSGTATDETNMRTFLFSGTGPASGTQGSALYTAASWITLNSTEKAQSGYHTGNPLNDESGSFNLPGYASALEGSATANKTDWKAYNYTFVNGQNPTGPSPDDHSATGSWANHEIRAQVIPSNSPYLLAISGTVTPSTGFWRGPNATSSNWPSELQGSTEMIPRWGGGYGATGFWYDLPVNNGGVSPTLPAALTAHGWVYNLYQGEIDMQNSAAGRAATASVNSATTLRWTYSWPTWIHNDNLNTTYVQDVTANNWQLGDVMEMAIPNMGSQSRLFFTGDGGQQDTAPVAVQTWGTFGMSAGDTTPVFGAGGTVSGVGFTAATNTPFAVPSDSLWMGSNMLGVPVPNQLNLPNRTSFSPGASASQLPFGGVWITRGYVDQTAPALVPNLADAASVASWRGFNGKAAGLINVDSTSKDSIYFVWLRHDPDKDTAWGTWEASKMVLDANNTYTATGGTTTVPGFAMVEGANNSTLPASYANDAQVSMAQGSLSASQNHQWNVDIGTDAALFAGSWSRNQWGLAAPTVGYQPAGTNNVRLVNPAFDSAPSARWSNQIGAFRALAPGAVSYDGGVRDSAIVYGVRKHTNENSAPQAELGLAGIEPGSPMLAQWYNLQETNDAPLNESRINNTGMSNVVAWPKVFTFYSPFFGNADWANVMEFKVNYLVGMRYPDSLTVPATNTLWKVPATMANAFELGKPVTDDMTPANTLNPGNPIVRPVQFLRISDFKNNTAPGAVLSTLDLATSDPTNSFTGAGALNPTGIGTTWIQSRSNVRLTWQSSVNNQVIPSGYIVEVFQLTGTAAITNQPSLLATVRAGHIGGKDAIQKLYLPSMHSFSGLDGNAAPNNAVYFFKVRTVWNKGISFEKQPTKQSIPSAYADYVSAPFVAHN